MWCKFCFFVGFWIKFGSRNLFFGLTSEKMFFSIQYLNILQFTKTFVDNIWVLSFKKSRNGCKSIFHECDKKIIKHFANQSFSVFKGAIFGIFEHTKTFFGKMFYNFFVTFMKNAFATNSWFFIKQNAHVVNNSFWKL